MKQKKRMKPLAFVKKYGRIMIGGGILLAVLMLGLLAPLITEYDPNVTYPYEKLKAIGQDGYVWGTDAWGRDVWTQICYGARLALALPVVTQILTMLIGIVVGLICGYYRKADMVISRLMEVLDSIPMFMLALLLCNIFGRTFINMAVSLALSRFVGVARMVRGRVMSIRKEEFIESEKVMGASDVRTLFYHVLPACTNTLLVRFSTGLAGVLLSMVGLSFMSVGIRQSVPNWGVLISLGRTYFIMRPDYVLIPAVFIIVTTFGFSMLGDGMRNVIGSGRSN